MSSAELQQETVAPFPQRQATETTDLSTRNTMTETFPWKRFDDKKPELLTIRPYVIKRADYNQILRETKRLQTIQDEISALEEKIGPLKAEVFYQDLDGESDSESTEKRKLRMIEARIAELSQNPIPAEYKVTEFFLKVIVEWPFVIKRKDEEGNFIKDAAGNFILDPIPLTVDGFLSLDPDFLNWLEEDLSSFLYGEDRKKRRKGKSRN